MGKDAFEAANRHFDEGKFAEAKAGYERLAAGGERSANLFYNLGNAEFRLGEPGRAALGYERALALEPGHRDAARNLAFVREGSRAKVSAPAWDDRLVPRWRADLFAVIASGAAWAVVSLGTAVVVRRRRGGIGVWFAFVAALAVGAYAGLALWREAQRSGDAIVTAREAVARLAPADSAAPAETLPAGSRVRVLSERGAWVYCELPGRERGWLSAAAVEKVRLSNG